eukprot:4594471-Prorocentrum_lima.AAC.1
MALSPRKAPRCRQGKKVDAADDDVASSSPGESRVRDAPERKGNGYLFFCPDHLRRMDHDTRGSMYLYTSNAEVEATNAAPHIKSVARWSKRHRG